MSKESAGNLVCHTETCGVGDAASGVAKAVTDVGYTLAANIAAVEYDDLPAEVIDVTKKTIIDTLGTILGGSGAGAGVKEVVELVRDGGGKEESSVMGYRFRTNAWMAAFANGAMAHTLDFDNAHDEAFTHPSTSTVPAALAVAERVGEVSGKEFITAMALGDDLHCRLGYSLARVGDPARQGAWMPPVALGGFAAAAVAAKLLKLDRDGIVDAFGIVFNRTGGTVEIVETPIPGLLRGLYAAFPAMTGVLSAVMAERGIPGVKTCFEGKAGLYNVYFRGLYDRASLTEGLGKHFEGAEVSFKPWPCCRFTNPYIDAMLQIVRAQDLHPKDVERITVSYADDKAKNCCEPLEVRRNPLTPPEAKLSIPFTIAVAFTRKNVEIGDFSPESLQSPILHELAQKVFSRYDAQLKSSSKSMLPGVVEVKLKDGREFSKRVDVIYGHPSNPMSWKDLSEKFRDCASYAASPIPKENLDQAIEEFTSLERVKNVREIIRLLT
jgi:2-methylcitrate dehydratase PrpD